MVASWAGWVGLVSWAMASSGGIINQSQGCGSCHGARDSAVTVSLSTVDPVVDTGQTVTLVLTVASPDPTHVAGSFSLEATRGAFASGPGMRAISGIYLTHTTAQAFVGGATTWRVQWTAPALPGTVTFSVAGNAVNLNGRRDNGDGWNTASLMVQVDGECPDEDGDRVTICDGDCDDTRADVYPSNPEIWYDGVDQDCDGNDDDQDGDGVPVGQDCDDTRAAVQTGCDGTGGDTDGPHDTDPVGPTASTESDAGELEGADEPAPGAEDAAGGCADLGGQPLWVGGVVGSLGLLRRRRR